jgi:hypothetical protein
MFLHRRLAFVLGCLLLLVAGQWKTLGSMTLISGIPSIHGQTENRIICGNDPVNKHDALGMAPLSSCAPSDKEIAAQIRALEGSLAIQRRTALNRNSQDCIGWRPEQFVKWGSDAEYSALHFLRNVQSARKALGPDGYGKWSTSTVLNRTFGDTYNEEILRYFEPEGGYVVSPEMRQQFQAVSTLATVYVGLAVGALPGPEELLLAGLANRSQMAANRGMLSPGELMGVEKATPELLDAMRQKGRYVKIATPGSDEMRLLDYFNAEANVGGADKTHILLRPNPSKPAALEEFLHGTQKRLGLIDRLGEQDAEVHVKDFMIRHRELLGLGDEDVAILRILKQREAALLER